MKPQKKRYEDICPSNKTEFRMLYYYAVRTLNILRIIIIQEYGKQSSYANRIIRLNHKIEQMVARYKQLELELKILKNTNKK